MKDKIKELFRLISEMNTHTYSTNEHYHNAYENVCNMLDDLKQQPSEIDQLIDNFKKGKEYAKNKGERESVLYTYDFIIEMIKNHRP